MVSQSYNFEVSGRTSFTCLCHGGKHRCIYGTDPNAETNEGLTISEPLLWLIQKTEEQGEGETKLKPKLDKTLTMKTVITQYDHNRRPDQEQKDTEDSNTQEGNEGSGNTWRHK